MDVYVCECMFWMNMWIMKMMNCDFLWSLNEFYSESSWSSLSSYGFTSLIPQSVTLTFLRGTAVLGSLGTSPSTLITSCGNSKGIVKIGFGKLKNLKRKQIILTKEIGAHKTKGCQKVVKNVVNIDIFMVVTLKVVKVVSADNEKVVSLTPQIVILTTFDDNLGSEGC